MIKSLVGLIMLAFIFRTAISMFALDRKYKQLATVKEVLDSIFEPILDFIRQFNLNIKVQGQEVDLSGMVFIFSLWILQKILDLL